jgi:hypothetical protein
MLPQNASFYSIPTIAGSPSNALAGRHGSFCSGSPGGIHVPPTGGETRRYLSAFFTFSDATATR